MNTEKLVGGLENQRNFFLKSVSCLTEEDAAFRPKDEMLCVKRQVAHVAHTVDWFIEGAFSPEGMDMDWEAHAKKEEAVATLAEAKDWLNAAYDRAVAAVRAHSWEEWQTPMSEKSIMGGASRVAVLSGMADHTAHHRGSLVVYARLLGKTPEMPYM